MCATSKAWCELVVLVLWLVPAFDPLSIKAYAILEAFFLVRNQDFCQFIVKSDGYTLISRFNIQSLDLSLHDKIFEVVHGICVDFDFCFFSLHFQSQNRRVELLIGLTITL